MRTSFHLFSQSKYCTTFWRNTARPPRSLQDLGTFQEPITSSYSPEEPLFIALPILEWANEWVLLYFVHVSNLPPNANARTLSMYVCSPRWCTEYIFAMRLQGRGPVTVSVRNRVAVTFMDTIVTIRYSRWDHVVCYTNQKRISVIKHTVILLGGGGGVLCVSRPPKVLQHNHYHQQLINLFYV